MENNSIDIYKSFSVSVTITNTGRNRKNTLELFARLTTGKYFELNDVLKFSDDLKKIVKALHKASSDSGITITFSRYTHNETGITERRTATNTMTALELLDNGGMYLVDEYGNAEADFWLDINADLLESLQAFSDAEWYFYC